MSTLKLSLLLSLVLSVCACSQISPFEDRRREPGTVQVYVGASKPDAPAICYNPLISDDAEIKSLADEICQSTDSNKTAEFVKKEGFSCRLFVPSKAYYECVAKK